MRACRCAGSACGAGLVGVDCAAALRPTQAPRFVVTTTLILMVLVISDYYPSQAALEVKIYRRLSDAESADLHQRWRTRMRPDW